MFSIIIPTLNEEKFLPHLLDSLITQTKQDFEVIVVDGISKDKTVEIARSYAKKIPNFQVVVSKKRNLSFQRNFGASIAKGEWLIFIDADSAVLPYLIDRVDHFIATKHTTFFTTWFSSDSETVNEAMVTLLICMVIEGALLMHRPVAPGPFTAVLKETFIRVGGYDESVEWGEDYDLTKRICTSGVQLDMLRETLYIYSLRRLRHQGTLRVLRSYARAIFSVLLINRTPKHMPGYVLGGHIYNQKKKPIKRGMLVRFNKQLRGIVKELFD